MGKNQGEVGGTINTVFFTIVDDYYYNQVGTPIMINSFKRFHPDIDLVVFRQDMIDKVFKEKEINFYQAKPTFAKLLTPHYDLVVNLDADTVITSRLEPVLTADYEVGAVWNFNDYENASFENITAEMYLQAGLVASTKKEFWDEWEEKNKNAMKYIRQENDVLNKVVYGNGTEPKYKLKIFDKDYGYMGCKSLDREKEFVMVGDKLMCRGEEVYAYHWAKGRNFPKLQFERMGLSNIDALNYLKACGGYGKSVRYGSL